MIKQLLTTEVVNTMKVAAIVGATFLLCSLGMMLRELDSNHIWTQVFPWF